MTAKKNVTDVTGKIICEKIYQKGKAGQTPFWIKRKETATRNRTFLSQRRRYDSGNNLLPDEILKITKQYKVPESCYIIAYQKELDKKYVSFEDALGLVLGNGMAAIIICNDFAVIETEQYSGTPFRYILHG